MTLPAIACLPGAEAFADLLGCPGVEMEFDAFPDGESYVRCLSDVAGQSVAVIAQLNNPDPQLMRLLLTARTLKTLGTRRVGLIAPYLPYLRQDVAFQAGESVSAQHFGRFLSDIFDWLVTVDPHLHRLTSLSDVMTVPATAASSAGPVAGWIRDTVKDPVLIGPDMESRQWVETLSDLLDGAPFHVFEKTRLDAWSVEIASAEVPGIADRTPVIIDDIASTGQTLLTLAQTLAPICPHKPFCCVTHGVFSEPVRLKLDAAFQGRLVTTNTIAGPSARIDVSGEVKQAVLALAANDQGQ